MKQRRLNCPSCLFMDLRVERKGGKKIGIQAKGQEGQGGSRHERAHPLNWRRHRGDRKIPREGISGMDETKSGGGGGGGVGPPLPSLGCRRRRRRRDE